MKDMKAVEISVRLYRSLYWANQGLLQAVRSLEELRGESASVSLQADSLLYDRLRRTQAMIEETRLVMNRNLSEWIERNE